MRLLGGLRIVRHHHDRLAELVVQPLEQAEDLLAGRAVEVAGRLVGDDQRRVGNERAGDRHPLLLAARQLVRTVIARGRRVRPARAPVSTRSPALAARQRGEQQRQLDVVERRQHRHQVVELEDEADVRGAPRGEFARRESRAMSTPATRISPEVGLSMPATRLSSVDLPEPDGPISAM